MSKRTSLTLLLLLLSLFGSACGLLGLTRTDHKPQEVSATLDALAAAGESKDLETIKYYLASSIVASIEGGIPLVGEGLAPQSAGGVVDLLETAWAGVTMHKVSLNATSIAINGAAAIAEGTFLIEYTDAEGRLKRCVGTGSIELRSADGRWQVVVVVVDQIDCTVVSEPGHNEPGPGDPGSGDPGQVDPGQGEPGNEPGPGPGTGAPAHAFSVCDYLVIGAQGEQVLALQSSLKYLGFYSGRLDGDFGPMTQSSVKAFQTSAGLYVDGEAGPKTLKALDERLKKDGGYFKCDVWLDKPSSWPTTLTYSALRKGTPFETEVLTYQSPNPGPTIVLIGCIHGNERSGHLALNEAIDKGITISRGRLVIVPAFNRLACEQNGRTLTYKGDVLSGKDFNRMFPVGKKPSYYIAQEMWDLIKSQPNLVMVVDFHDGFIDSLGNTLIHTRQSEAGRVARKLRDVLNSIRPSNAKGPKWRALTEPISGSLTRKVGRDLGIPAMEVELSGRNPGDPLSLRIKYAHTLIKELGREYGMEIVF